MNNSANQPKGEHAAVLVRCSKCNTPFTNPMQHTGCCDQVFDGWRCNGTAERYTEGPSDPWAPDWLQEERFDRDFTRVFRRDK